MFFDEMDSIFRTRGTGHLLRRGVHDRARSCCRELDGVETLKNVIVIGASNREDLIDPAILRPGPPRREDQDRAPRRGTRRKDIMAKYLHPSVPIHPDEIARHGGDASRPATAMIEKTVEQMYEPNDAQPVPRGHVRLRRQGDPVLQGLQLRRHDREHRAPGEEGRHQALPVHGREGHQERGPAPRDPRRVQGERGPARTPRTPTTGPGSRARRASGSCTSARCSGDDGDGRQVERVNAGQYL